MLEWQVGSSNEASAVGGQRQPLNLPPPSTLSSGDGEAGGEVPGHMEGGGVGQRGVEEVGVGQRDVEEGVKSISIREGMESRDEEGAGMEVESSGEGKEVEEEECKSGVKRPLPPSPQFPCEEGKAVASAAADGSGPEIKRRNLALYSDSLSAELEQDKYL